MVPFSQLRIVFFGTPDFAVASLKALVDAGANIVAVVTAPDKPAGRGMQLQAPAVKEYALAQNLPILQPEKLKASDFIDTLKELKADVHIVVAFRMLPEAVWSMPQMGTINVHASLLPAYRGAAPINWAIINGETETGVTTFKLQHAIDTGNILLQRTIPILPEDNVGTLYDKLMAAGAELLVETLQGLTQGTITELPQLPTENEKHAPKIFKEHLEIKWDRPAAAIHNQIRGLSPYPTAFTYLNGKQLKIYKSHYELEATTEVYGSYETDNKTYLRFSCEDGWLYADELQLEGKKKMDVKAFLLGFRA